MTKTIQTIGLLIFISLGQFAFGQSNKEKALAKGQAAIELMDNGKIEESIKLLEDAQKLDPGRYDYPYEIAHAYYLKKDYKGAIKILENIENYKDITDLLFQLLGNSYDLLGKSDKALDVYQRGLKKFPESGRLYLESGIVEMGKQEFNKALDCFENGIDKEPAFPSNYFWAAKIYCNSSEKVWGMIYGEIFMNMERNTGRTSEISQLLYETYQNGTALNKDSLFSVSFSQNATINLEDLKNSGKMKMPFGIGVYEPTLIFSLLGVKKLDINSLNIVRSNFVDNYFKNGNNETYPNILFDYQKKIQDAGHLEAYNYWILMKGDEDGFDEWAAANKQKWDSFVTWFTNNQLKIDDKHKFFSGQY